VIVHARTRELAIARMRRALDAMVIEGIKTTIPLHLKIMDNVDFQKGNFSTRFMEEFLDKNKIRESAPMTAPAALTGVSA
jgi:acetyl-CoA carboxylase biotin carboxylase subunit